ncbi:hypothetical protein ACWDRM_03815 [Streptomyces cellulosae]
MARPFRGVRSAALEGIDTTGWLYERRRAALERLYAERRLSGTWVLCPSTTD